MMIPYIFHHVANHENHTENEFLPATGNLYLGVLHNLILNLQLDHRRANFGLFLGRASRR